MDTAYSNSSVRKILDFGTFRFCCQQYEINVIIRTYVCSLSLSLCIFTSIILYYSSRGQTSRVQDPQDPRAPLDSVDMKAYMDPGLDQQQIGWELLCDVGRIFWTVQCHCILCGL